MFKIGTAFGLLHDLLAVDLDDMSLAGVEYRFVPARGLVESKFMK
jgi:hypothetical protein